MKQIWFGLLIGAAAWTGAAARTVYSVQPVADVELSGRVYQSGYIAGEGLAVAGQPTMS